MSTYWKFTTFEPEQHGVCFCCGEEADIDVNDFCERCFSPAFEEIENIFETEPDYLEER